MTSLKGHGSLQNVPPHVLQDDHADYEAVADGPCSTFRLMFSHFEVTRDHVLQAHML